MERLAERRGEQLLAAAERLPAGRERLAQGLDLLWAGYASPLYQAALDLWTHARTDPELRERLAAVERDLDRQTLRLSRTLFGELAERPGFDRLVEMADGDDARPRAARHAAPGRRAQPPAVALLPRALVEMFEPAAWGEA